MLSVVRSRCPSRPASANGQRPTGNSKIRGMMRFAAAIFLAAQIASAASIAPAEYQTRRAKLAKDLGPNAMLIVFSAKPKARDMDIEYPYRQSDSMLYLTGIDEADATLVLLPGENDYRE